MPRSKRRARGRHGKGFAVVADEVRNLAARSAKAAKETAEMIEGSLRKVEEGTSITTKTAESLVEIAGSATKVADLVAEIAAASNEQAQGIAQVSQGLGQIDQVTQQNTASAEETASSSEELAAQAAELRHVVATFKLSADGDGAKEIEAQAPRAAARKHAPAQIAPPKTQQRGPAGLPAKRHDGRTVKPSDVITLDDAEFGKF